MNVLPLPPALSPVSVKERDASLLWRFVFSRPYEAPVRVGIFGEGSPQPPWVPACSLRIISPSGAVAVSHRVEVKAIQYRERDSVASLRFAFAARAEGSEAMLRGELDFWVSNSYQPALFTPTTAGTFTLSQPFTPTVRLTPFVDVIYLPAGDVPMKWSRLDASDPLVFFHPGSAAHRRHLPRPGRLRALPECLEPGSAEWAQLSHLAL